MSLSRLDLLLLLMVVIWGSNFSVIKYALREFPEISFNALRLLLASAVFLAAIGVQRRRLRVPRPAGPARLPEAAIGPLPGLAPHPDTVPEPVRTEPEYPCTAPERPPHLVHLPHPRTARVHLPRRRSAPHPSHRAHLSHRVHLSRDDWRRLFVLGLVGHLLYQLFFLAGVARTSVANSALIFGCTPVVVAIMASIAGHERLSMLRWAGAALSFAGIYAIVGHRAELSTATLTGDVLVLGGMLCWSLYSVLAQPLLARHSPLVVTGWSMTIGTGLYLIVAIRPFITTDWAAISVTSWWLMAASSLLALAFAYMIWYTAVQRIGSSRTAIYSNLTPIVAMVVAALWLGEHIGAGQLLGAALILSGIAVTRLQGH